MITLKANVAFGVSSFLKLNLRSIKYSLKSQNIINSDLFKKEINQKSFYSTIKSLNNLNSKTSITIVKNVDWNRQLISGYRHYCNKSTELPTLNTEQELVDYIKLELQPLYTNCDDREIIKEKVNTLILILKKNNNNYKCYTKMLGDLSNAKFLLNADTKTKESLSQILEIYKDLPSHKDVIMWLIEYWYKDGNLQELAKILYSQFQMTPNEWLELFSPIYLSLDYFTEEQKKNIRDHFYKVEIDGIPKQCLLSYIYSKSSDMAHLEHSRELLKKAMESYQKSPNPQYKELYITSLRAMFSMNCSLFTSISNESLLESFHMYLNEIQPNESLELVNMVMTFQSRFPSPQKVTMEMLNEIIKKFGSLKKNDGLEVAIKVKARFLDMIYNVSSGESKPLSEDDLSEAERNGDCDTFANLIVHRFQQLMQPKPNSKYNYAFSLGLNIANLQAKNIATNDLHYSLELLKDYHQQITHMDTSHFTKEQMEMVNLSLRAYKFFNTVLSEDTTQENFKDISYYISEVLDTISQMEYYCYSEINRIRNLANTNKFQEALNELTDLENNLLHRTDNIDVITHKAMCYYYMEDFSKTIDTFKELFRVFKKQKFVASPVLSPVMEYMVYCLDKQQRKSEIEEVLDWYFSLEGIDKTANPRLLEYHAISTYPTSKSEKILKEIVQLGCETIMLDPYLYLGEINRANLNSQVAVGYYSEGLKKENNPFKKDLLIGMGEAYLRMNDRWRDALDAYEEALKIDRENPVAYLKIAEIANLFEKDATKAMEYSRKSIELLEKTMKDTPSDQSKRDLLDAFHHYGTALNTLGKSKEANRVFKSTLKLLYNSPEEAKNRPTLFYMIYNSGLIHCVNTFNEHKDDKFFFTTSKEIDIPQLYSELEKRDRTFEESKESLYLILDVVNALKEDNEREYPSETQEIHNDFLKELKDSIQNGILSINLFQSSNQFESHLEKEINEMIFSTYHLVLNLLNLNPENPNDNK
ncbi:hypothetical protein DLAC_02879 [Tieghemostelium lacteum]|uniref:Uncharacterized protein n=1 Tax=Tieghemostelium lacteum TaxID=361077 RepID=A0A152A429_TIELA|nr:hypothetical protein DLAC_02879 [Tieghemostelium lacteum]|eukprot:KYR00827.1 hypothetical protein DLAC_02879 [Tieghemostelium lacteum]